MPASNQIINKTKATRVLTVKLLTLLTLLANYIPVQIICISPLHPLIQKRKHLKPIFNGTEKIYFHYL